MNRQAALIALFGLAMAGVGYGIGCLKTRGEVMEAIAKSVVNHYANKDDSQK